MKSIAVSFALAVALAATGAHAQPSPGTTAACLPARTLDELTAALDEAVSGPANKDRTCLRQVMAPGARLTPVHKSPDGSILARNFTVDDWINAVAKRGSEEVYERQITVATQQYGHIAQLWSSYELRATPDGKATSRGTNGFQAVYDGSRWAIVAVLWEAEESAGPAPVKTP